MENEDMPGIAFGILMIIGTLLPYLSIFGVEESLIGTKSGTIVIVGGAITIISSLFFSRIRVGCVIGGAVSLIGMYEAGIYYNESLSEYSDLAILIDSEIGYYVILLSSVVAIIDGIISLIKCLFKK